MLFILKNELKQLEQAKHEHAAVASLDKRNEAIAKANIKSILSSKEGLIAAFSAGFLKGMSNSKTTDHSVCYSSTDWVKLLSTLLNKGL